VTEAEKLFNETYARWLHASSLIHGFRRSFTEVSDTVADRLQAESVTLFRDLIEDPQWKGLHKTESIDSLLSACFSSLPAISRIPPRNISKVQAESKAAVSNQTSGSTLD